MTDLSTTHLQRLLDEATPGPWEVDQLEEQFADCPEVTGFYLYSEDTQYIAKGEAVSKYRDREEANFRLIALAPELAQEVLRMREELANWANDEAQAHNALVKRAQETGAAGIITTHKTIYNRIIEILGDHDG